MPASRWRVLLAAAAARAACKRNACDACAGRTKRAPKFYSKLWPDGAGTTVKHVLEHARFAWSRGYAYGGAVGKLPRAPGPHGVVQRSLLEFAVGADVLRAQPPAGALKIGAARESPADAARDDAALRRARNRTVYWTAKQVVLEKGGDGPWFSALRDGFACRLQSWRPRLTFKRGVATVAAHLRRGDVDVGTQPRLRWVADDCVLRALAWIRSELGRVDAHVFSSVVRSGRGKGTDARSFDVFRRNGTAVHLDDERGDRTATALLAWAHLAAADVMLAAPTSSFSAVPAYLSAGCVLQPRTRDADGYHCYALDAADRACVRRATRRRRV